MMEFRNSTQTISPCQSACRAPGFDFYLIIDALQSEKTRVTFNWGQLENLLRFSFASSGSAPPASPCALPSIPWLLQGFARFQGRSAEFKWIK